MEKQVVYVLVFDDYEDTHVIGVYSDIDKAIESAVKHKIVGDSEFCSKQEIVKELEKGDYAILSPYFSIHPFIINDQNK